MAKPQRPQPRWPKPTQDRVDILVENFRDDLRRIATRLARHEEALNVDVRHVNEAFTSLARLGLNRLTGWRRPESEVGLGAFLAGVSFSTPGVVPLFFDATRAKGATVGTLHFLFAVGVFLMCHGWFRGKL